VNIKPKKIYKEKKILSLVPNRPPFLLLDKVFHYNKELSIKTDYCFAQKKFNKKDFISNSNIFLVEALAQLAYCMFSLGYSFQDFQTSKFRPKAAFLGIEDTQFFSNNIPLGNVNFSVKLYRHLKPYAIFEGRAYTNMLLAKTRLIFLETNE
jgi:3-hydroxymyristoyl/3-hydroxydecanoyl-(acyl carrier protein) dehydratase